MKVFISHKKEDEDAALEVRKAFTEKGVPAYLDLLDASVISEGKQLTDHIKKNLNQCTDIIVIMSEKTKYSWWVPFEIGMSAQIDMPTASFLTSDVSMPSYLSYWPRLKSPRDVETYIAIRSQTQKEIRSMYGYRDTAEIRAAETAMFYTELKKRL